MKKLLLIILAWGLCYWEVSAENLARPALDTFVVQLDTAVAVTCPGGNDGSIRVLAEGGELPYQFLWSNGDTTQHLDSLEAGFYSLTLTDALGGQATLDSIQVTGPAPFQISFDTLQLPTCSGGLGSLLLVVAGGTPGYTYLWSNGDTGPVADSLHVGLHSCTVTDTLGCKASAILDLPSDFPLLQLELGVSGPVFCSPDTVTLTAATASAGVVFAWAGPNGFAATDSVAQTTLPGLYFATAFDTIVGCLALDSIFVVGDTILPIADAGTGFTLDCEVLSGSLNGGASSLDSTFQYQWTTADGNITAGDTTLLPTVDAGGTYTLTVTNPRNGCSAASAVFVEQFTPLVFDSVAVQNVTCSGDGDASISLAVSGGTGAYTYIWSNGSTSATASGLVAGTYTVSIADDRNCSVTDTFFLAQPDILTANAAANGQTAAGVNDGQAFAYPNGGVAPFSYAWPNGDTIPEIDSLAPGAYTVTVTDANGCTAIGTANVNQFGCLLNGYVEVAPAECFGLANGSATVLLSDEVLPIKYMWSNGDSLDIVMGLSAGLHTVTVQDASNCSLFFELQINQPAALMLEETAHGNVACPNNPAGFSAVLANGGAQPYAYLWPGGSMAASATGLVAGEYLVTATDGNGCQQNLSVVIASLDTLAPSLAVQNIIVYLDTNGEAAVSAAHFDIGSSDDCGITNWALSQTAFDCSSLGTTTVALSATDGTGNTAETSAIVTVFDTLAPSLACPASVTVSGCNAAVSYALPTVLDNCPFDPSRLQLVAGLAAGEAFPTGMTQQQFTYADVAGNVGTCSFEVTVVPALEVSLSSQNAACYGACNGALALSISGGLQPYQILWSTGQSGTSLSSLCAGQYSATITDNDGCSMTVGSTLTEPAPLLLNIAEAVSPLCPTDLSGSISAQASGGTGPYQYHWSNGSSESQLTGLGIGTYALTLTDANGCAEASAATLSPTDLTPPTLALQNLVLSLNANGSVQVTPAMFDAGSTDTCGIVSWTVAPTSFHCGDVGVQTVVISATDANGNTAIGTATVTVEDNTPPTIDCPQNLAVSYCNANFNFNLPIVVDNCGGDNPQPTLLAGLPPGSTFPFGTTIETYGYTDAGGNSVSCSFTVTVLGVAQISPDVANISCTGECDGSVSLNISGGFPPFLVDWSNGQTGQTASGLCAGTVSASITDASGCLQVFTATITEPGELALNVDQVVNDLDNAGLGAIGISVSGGTAPFSFQWVLDGQVIGNTEDLTGLHEGEYTVLVTDNNGCTVASEGIVVENTMTATSDLWLAGGVSLQPNPASHSARLAWETPLPFPVEVRLTDAAGVQIHLQQVPAGELEHTIGVDKLSPGTYQLTISGQGRQASRQLIVVR